MSRVSLVLPFVSQFQGLAVWRMAVYYLVVLTSLTISTYYLGNNVYTIIREEVSS